MSDIVHVLRMFIQARTQPSFITALALLMFEKVQLHSACKLCCSCVNALQDGCCEDEAADFVSLAKTVPLHSTAKLEAADNSPMQGLLQEATALSALYAYWSVHAVLMTHT